MQEEFEQPFEDSSVDETQTETALPDSTADAGNNTDGGEDSQDAGLTDEQFLEAFTGEVPEGDDKGTQTETEEGESTELSELPEKFSLKYKANGQEHEIKDLESLRSELAKAADYTKKTQDLAQIRSEYAEFEKEIDADPQYAKALELLHNIPGLRSATLALYENLVKKGAIHPDSIKAATYERNERNRQELTQSAQKEEQLNSAKNAVREHVSAIETEIGQKPGKEYIGKLMEMVKQKRVSNLLDAHKLYRVESGKYEEEVKKKTADELRSKQSKVRHAQGVAGRGSSSGAEIKKSDEEFGQELLSAMKGI